ncbi:MAG: hypothetical protein KA771_02735 [Spirochaetales bacterium]|nr:hypothetical protein [Spirochaetales bacterium]
MDSYSFSEKLGIWNPQPLEIGSCVHWSLGDLDVWAERYDIEWHVYFEHKKSLITGQEMQVRLEPRAEKPVTREWKHFLVRNAPCAYPTPAIPDRPLVVKPDRFLIILPGEIAQFFIFTPIWFRFTVGPLGRKISPRLLFEIPVFRMKSTWFGDPIVGELCYYTEARLFTDFHSLPEHPLYAVCPLRIRNESNTELPFDKICLHTEVLSLYGGENRLWTNACDVIFKGVDQATQVEPSKSPPAFEPKVRLLSPPRQASDVWYFKRTFNLLKIITGF